MDIVLTFLEMMIERNGWRGGYPLRSIELNLAWRWRPPVSVVKIFIVEKERICQKRKTTPQVRHLINKTIIFCQEKNKPVYVMCKEN